MIVADSDILIDALHGRNPAAERIRLELSTGGLATTAISVFELKSGARSRRAAAQVETLLAPLTILPIDEQAAEKAGRIRRDLDSVGTPISMADYLIAGICVSRSAILLTRNRTHFERVPGLTLGRLEASGETEASR